MSQGSATGCTWTGCRAGQNGGGGGDGEVGEQARRVVGDCARNGGALRSRRQGNGKGGWRSRPGRRDTGKAPDRAAPLRPGEAQGTVGAATPLPSREQLQRGGEEPEQGRGGARQGEQGHAGIPGRRTQGTGAHLQQLDGAPRALLRESGRRREG